MAPGVHPVAVPLASRHEPVARLARWLPLIAADTTIAPRLYVAARRDDLNMRDKSLGKLVRCKAGRFAARQKCRTQALRQKIVR